MVDPVGISTRAALTSALHALYEADGRSYLDLAAASGVGQATIHDMAAGKSFPQWKTLRAVLLTYGIHASALEPWRHAHTRAKSDNAHGLGWPLEQIDDPFVLEVHRPITLDTKTVLPPLPPYVPRAHDRKLAKVVEHARSGVSAMAVLVAGSSAGKTRALWEALAPLRTAGGWRLWHPSSPTRRDALATELGRVGPRTVVWLNETQEYLGHGSGGDEQAATALRDLLTDRDRAPVLIVGTLWPLHHDTLCRVQGSQARALLQERAIEVADCFTGADLDAAGAAAGSDPRWAMALERSSDGRVTQYLAGGPELVARYRFSLSAAARAIVEVAIDARRMGHRNALPHALLETAAHAYMAGDDWDALGEDWFERALAETSQPCRGARGPLTRIRPRPVSSRTGTPGYDAASSGPLYQLADYLEQHGRIARAEKIPPIPFWEAAATHAHPGDLTALGNTAWVRGLYRDATQLWKNATQHGDIDAATQLIRAFRYMQARDERPATWAATHAHLDNPTGVAGLVEALRDMGLTEQLETLATRTATSTPLDDPGGAAQLLDTLRGTGLTEQLETLATRTANDALLDYAGGVARLLNVLRDMGLTEQLETLATRTGNDTPLNDPLGVVELLDTLWDMGLTEQLETLATRTATDAPIDDPGDGAVLVDALRDAGLTEQLETLATRTAIDAPVDVPGGVAALVDALRDTGLTRQLEILATRTITDAPVDVPGGVAALVGALRDTGLTRQLEILATRAATKVPLDYAGGVAELLDALWYTGLTEQLETLAARSPATNAPLDNPSGVAQLLRALRHTGLTEQLETLATRTATNAPVDSMFGVAVLLHVLRDAGLTEQLETLATRTATDTPLDNARDVARLLETLRDTELTRQFETLATRTATDALFDNAGSVAELLDTLRDMGLTKQLETLATRTATDIPLDNAGDVARLLDTLRDTGLTDQLETLAARLPAAGMFQQFLRMRGDDPGKFWFGREPDGAEAATWTWDDLTHIQISLTSTNRTRITWSRPISPY
ncbi:hypothetical protein ACQP0C_31050 [Nocardia sp. CA-129566]|uniref:hypothetical protein n=1 Tax=Nocardia sp. CA-129566 TaxID=3239976 RepID=UPI003D960C33